MVAYKFESKDKENKDENMTKKLASGQKNCCNSSHLDFKIFVHF